MSKDFIANAIRRPGALRRKAKKAGETTSTFAKKEKNAPGLTGKQSRFALFLKRVRPH